MLPPWLMYDPVDCCCNPFRETKAWLTFNLELINTFYKGNYFPLEKGMTQDNRVWDAKMLLYCLANMLFQWMSFEWISGLTMWTPWVESEGVCGKTSNICKIWTRIWVQGRGDHMTLITLWNLIALPSVTGRLGHVCSCGQRRLAYCFLDVWELF